MEHFCFDTAVSSALLVFQQPNMGLVWDMFTSFLRKVHKLLAMSLNVMSI